MKLDKKQKESIREKARYSSGKMIAAELGIPEKQVRKYLQKVWKKDKYEKWLRKDKRQKSEEARAGSAERTGFHFQEFLAQNMRFFLLLFFLVAAVYANSLGNNFVSDDILGIRDNQNLGKLSYIFSIVPGITQRILYFLTFHLGGHDPFYFRLLSVLIHLGNTFLVFAITGRLMKKPAAMMTSALFAVHPILTESVTWMSGMPYALYAFFFLLSLWFYIDIYPGKTRYRLSIFFFALSLVSSEKAIPLFLIFPLYEFVFGDLRKNWKRSLPYFILSLALASMFLFKIGGRIESVSTENYQNSSGLYNPIIQIPVAVATYLKLIVWPDKLSLYQTEMSFSRAAYLLHLVVFIALIGAVWVSFKKNRAVFFWLAFFFASLLVTLTPLKIAWVVAERYAYLGSLGVFAVFGILVEKLTELKNQKKFIYATFALLVMVLSVRTIFRNIDWKDEDHLWIATAKVSPSGQNIHNNLGDVYARQGDKEKAISEFKKAVEINPNYADAYHNLANTYRDAGQTDLAIENYKKAASLNPKIWQTYANMGQIYFDEGDFPDALENIQKALKIDPQNTNLQKALEAVQAKMK